MPQNKRKSEFVDSRSFECLAPRPAFDLVPGCMDRDDSFFALGGIGGPGQRIRPGRDLAEF